MNILGVLGMLLLTRENRELSENRETNKGFRGERMFKSGCRT